METTLANPQMITLARRSRGFTQTRLASLSGLSPATVSRYEAGTLSVSDDHLARISEVLDYPNRFFRRDAVLLGAGVGEMFHRKRQSLSVNKLHQMHAMAETRRLEAEILLRSWNGYETTVPEYPIDFYDDDPEKIARSVRRLMEIPPGPIFNLTRVLEQNGCLIFAHNFGVRQIDGFSHRPRLMPRVFHINANIPPDRWRWTLAHELGHLVMHFEPIEPSASPKLIEQQADLFAAEFLAPAHEIRPLLHDLSFQKLAGLKREWKISMQALIMRAYHLGTITAGQRKSMFTRLSKSGYRTREPEDLDPPVERPSRLFQLVRFHMEELEYTRQELMDVMAIGDTDFQTYYDDPDDVLHNLGIDELLNNTEGQ